MRHFLTPLRGWFPFWRPDPRLAAWAALFRRFAAAIPVVSDSVRRRTKNAVTDVTRKKGKAVEIRGLGGVSEVQSASNHQRPKNREPKPQSGERMQPTAQAVGIERKNQNQPRRGSRKPDSENLNDRVKARRTIASLTVPKKPCPKGETMKSRPITRRGMQVTHR